MTVHSDIDNIFNEGLNDYSEKAPAFIWDNINQELNKKRNKKNRNILYAFAASIALLLSFGSGYLFTDFNTNRIAENDTKSVNIESKQTNTSEIILIHKKTHSNNELSPINKSNIGKSNIKKPLKQKSIEKQTKPKNKSNSKIKKASSSGILLPPVFAEANNYNESRTSSIKNEKTTTNNKIELLTSLELKQTLLTTNKPEKDLVYEIRLLPLLPEPTTIHTTTVHKQWSVGLSGTPLLSYRHVQDIENETYAASANTSGLQQNYENERPLVSYSAGVNINYKFAKRWKIQSGFYMSETGQVINNIDLAQAPSSIYNYDSNAEYIINSSAGNIKIKGNSESLYNYANSNESYNYYSSKDALDRYGAELDQIEKSTTTAEFIQTLEYFEVPVVLAYKLVDRKLDVNISSGVSANFLVNNTTYLRNNNDRQDINAEVEGIKSMNYSSIIGFGLEYPLIERLLLNLNPTFKYSINSVNTAGNVYPYSFGIYTGLKYNF